MKNYIVITKAIYIEKVAVHAKSVKDAKRKVLDEEFDDILDTYRDLNAEVEITEVEEVK